MSLRSQLGDDKYQSIELVVSSPLTRALMTACLGFSEHPILCHYHLREIGSLIPENIPRSTQAVFQDLVASGVDKETLQRIDVETLQPELWPKHHDTPPKVVRRDRIRDAFGYLMQRPEQTLAIVCHYHVIRAALSSQEIRPTNACVIECRLCGGELRLAHC